MDAKDQKLHNCGEYRGNRLVCSTVDAKAMGPILFLLAIAEVVFSNSGDW